MTQAEGWDLILKALASFGGVGAVTIAISAFASKWMADRSVESHKAVLGQETERLKGELAKETETHKLSLKKREILYQREIDAASAFVALHRQIEPKYSHPDMDWDEALETVVTNFGEIEGLLSGFIASHGAATSHDNRNQIDTCLLSASSNKFSYRDGSRESAKIVADEMLRILKAIEQRFLSEMRA